MDFETWQESVPAQIRADSLWRVTAYRLALFAADQAWDDVVALRRSPTTVAISDQLFRAVGSIGANIAEGYGRSSGRDRVRFLEYALSSEREAGHWYYVGRRQLPSGVMDSRLDILQRIRQLLLAAIPSDRKRIIRPGNEPGSPGRRHTSDPHGDRC